jgi:1-acyl-sn-glycerol-3-phosphate acyltransferase
MISFYPQLFRIIWKNSRRAVKGDYDGDDWANSSLDILRALENVGVLFEITGLDNLKSFEGPAVFIANHMSTLETFILPCIIQPLKPVTFVVKKSLVSTPVFGPIMRSRDPIVVGRINPREDLKAVLNEGAKKIEQGVSIVIFPQSTRSNDFKPDEFNSLGIKLALKAGVPVVPLALKTDAWGKGKIIKDFGPVDKNKKVFFAFGEPMKIKGRGAEEHQKVIDFIQDNLSQWAAQ